MVNVLAVAVIARDNPTRGDSSRNCSLVRASASPRRIEKRDVAIFLAKESMVDGAKVIVVSDDLSLRVDASGERPRTARIGRRGHSIKGLERTVMLA